ncbi:hypothetical protein BJX76DRAFT_240784 [Aspergillus varians]
MDDMMTEGDIRDDVNIFIFDYILCMTIHTAMYMTKDNLGKWDTSMTWLEDTIRMIRSMLPPTQELPVTLRMKTQVLEIIRMFNTTVETGPIILAEMASTFVSTSKSAGKKEIEPHATKVAIQLCIYAAFRAHRDPDSGASEGYAEYLASLSQGERRGKAPEYVTQVLSSMGISVETSLETVRQTVRMNGSGPTTILDTLVDIMQLLEPPILLQLERGRLEGLTRAETEHLKRRVGMD